MTITRTITRRTITAPLLATVLATLALTLYGAFGGVAVTRGPYLALTTAESTVVRWRTDVPVGSRVLYGDAPDNLAFAVVDPATVTEHAVAVAGLQPGTRYYYAVATPDEVLAGSDADHFFVTAPGPAAGPFRVWVLGDSGTGTEEAAAVRDAYLAFTGERPTDLWLMLGDNAYFDGTDAQHQLRLFDVYPTVLRQSPLWPALGNHDAHTSDSPTQTGAFFTAFTLPTVGEAGGVPSGTEAYYAFDWGDVHFICLDTADSDLAPGSPMLEWLTADVNAAPQPWIVAVLHHPPYTQGTHDSDDPVDSGGRMVAVREHALPILEAAGVDLVLAGHSHAYERSLLIDGHYGYSDSFDPATMVLDPGDGRPDGDGAYFKPARSHGGAVYVVAGSSGQTGGGTFDHPALPVGFRSLGSLVLDVAGPRLDVTFLSDEGVVRDRFTLVDGPRPDLAIADTAASEMSETGAGGEAVFTVSLTAPVPVDVTVHFATADGTAIAGADYVAAAGTLTFPAGETAATVRVTVLADAELEGDETFFVNLTGQRNATLFDDHAVATILSDAAVIFSDRFESGDLSAWSSASP